MWIKREVQETVIKTILVCDICKEEESVTNRIEGLHFLNAQYNTATDSYAICSDCYKGKIAPLFA